jgi:hypothetical protein
MVEISADMIALSYETLLEYAQRSGHPLTCQEIKSRALSKYLVPFHGAHQVSDVTWKLCEGDIVWGSSKDRPALVVQFQIDQQERDSVEDGEIRTMKATGKLRWDWHTIEVCYDALSFCAYCVEDPTLKVHGRWDALC